MISHTFRLNAHIYVNGLFVMGARRFCGILYTLLSLVFAMTSNTAAAASFNTTEQIALFNSCGYGNDGARYTVFVASYYYPIPYEHRKDYLSLAVRVLIYDKDGNIINVPAAEVEVGGGPGHPFEALPGTGIYIGSTWGGSGNDIGKPPTSMMYDRIDVVVPNKSISIGGVAVQAGVVYKHMGNEGYYDGYDVYLSSLGAAFFPYHQSGTESGIPCSIIPDPTHPPEVGTKISMNAPDWDLGELTPGGESDNVLGAANQQLCFTYEGGTKSEAQKYIINATSQNGIIDRHYLLKSLDKPESPQAIPYSVNLDGGANHVLLPNTNNSFFTLNSTGKTCYVPTFHTSVPKGTKSGAYGDVLTFTVTTKP